MRTCSDLLDEIRGRIDFHARPDTHTPVDGLLLSKVAPQSAEPDYSLTEPLLVVMAQGGKRLLLGKEVYEYRAGQYLVVTANVPVTARYIDMDYAAPTLVMGLVLDAPTIAGLVLQDSTRHLARATKGPSAIAIADADGVLLDAVARLLRLLDSPRDIPVLASAIQREILWRVLSGPQGSALRQIGMADSDLAHVSLATKWICEHYSEPMRIEDLAKLAGLSVSAFHRHFKAITALSPLQFQKRIRLQIARSILLVDSGDVAGVGHSVGYDSPAQFSREYRRLFGAPPGQDAARLRSQNHPPPGPPCRDPQ